MAYDKRVALDVTYAKKRTWRRKWLVAAGGLAALLIGAFYAYILATTPYHATAVPRLLPEQEQIVDFPNGAGRFSGDRAELNSEVEVLRARGLLAQVVERLDLTSDPEFGARFRPEEAQRVRDAVISKLLEAVTIRTIPQSRVLHVTVESEDARKAALIADTIVELYVSHQIETKEKAAEQAVIWLTERVTAMQAKPQAAEAKVSVFNATTELVSVGGPSGVGAADQGVAWPYSDGAGSACSVGETECCLGSGGDISGES